MTFTVITRDSIRNHGKLHIRTGMYDPVPPAARILSFPSGFSEGFRSLVTPRRQGQPHLSRTYIATSRAVKAHSEQDHLKTNEEC